MLPSLEVLFAPAEFAALRQRDLSQTVCVVFDILRATTTMVTALANGASAIIPVSEIGEALQIRASLPDVLLGGERGGLRIRADQTGGTDFDFGNSPREFTPDKVHGKTIVMTTTNGTRALQACAGAQTILVAAFLNLRATAHWIETHRPAGLLLVCSGTIDQAAYEDALAAGALCNLIWPGYGAGQVADSAAIARQIYLGAQDDLLAALQNARNGRRLLALPELCDDVPLCAQRDSVELVTQMNKDGTVRLANG